MSAARARASRLAVPALASLLAASTLGLAAARPLPERPVLVPAAAAAGGWRVKSVNGCAFGAGLIAGGIAGMPASPFGGAFAIAVGVVVALAACT